MPVIQPISSRAPRRQFSQCHISTNEPHGTPLGDHFWLQAPQSGRRREGQPMCVLGGGGSGTEEK